MPAPRFDASGTATVMVVLKQSPRGAVSASASAAASRGPDPRELKKHFVSGDVEIEVPEVMSFALGTRSAARPRRVRTVRRAVPEVRVYHNLGVMIGRVNRSGLAALASDSRRVDSVSGIPSAKLIAPTRVAAAAAPTHEMTWGISRLRIPEVWSKGFTGKDVVIGHLDTGIVGKHSAFRDGAISQFAELDDDGNLKTHPVTKAWDSDDGRWHGTHTAGTLVGRPINDATGEHRIGVAPEASLASAIVIESGDVVARIVGGLDWIVGLSPRPRILNLSLGLDGEWAQFLNLIQILRGNNVLPVVAVGNEGAANSRSPGNYSEVLSVGMHDEQNLVDNRSGSQEFDRADDPLVPDLVAPGVKVLSARSKNEYAEMDGSSMATPHVSGIAALLLQARPNATVEQLEAAIYGSCSRPRSMRKDRANRGVPDAEKALALLNAAASARAAARRAPKKSRTPKPKPKSKRPKR